MSNMKFIDKRGIYLQQIACKNPEEVKEITVPDGFEIVTEKVFSRFVNVERIVLPASVRAIEAHSFEGCKNLKELVCPGITAIDEEDFIDCANVKELNFTEALETIRPYAFYRLTGLERLTFESIDNIDVRKSAFSSIPKSAEVVYPETSAKPVIPYSSDMGEYNKALIKPELLGLAPIVQLKAYAAAAADCDGKPEYDRYNTHEVYLNTAKRAKAFIMDGDLLVGIVYEENVAQFKYEKRTLLIGEAKRWFTSSEYDTSSDNNGAGYSETFDRAIYITLIPKEELGIK